MQYKNILPVLVAGFLIISCKSQTATENIAPVEVPVVSIQGKDLNVDHFYVADIRAVRNVELRSKISGFLDAIYVDEGQTVRKGQVLFKIGDNEYRSEVARAKAVLSNTKAEARVAELELQRIKTMVDKKIISQTELELAASKLNAAEAKIQESESALQNAQHKLSYTTIFAPFDGILDRIPLKPGSLVSEGTLISSVSDISSMYAYFNISENEYLAYFRKMTIDSQAEKRVACLELSDGKEFEHKGKIETIVSEFDESTGSISFRASFPNPGNMLKHKATGKVKLVTNLEQALTVPQKASFEIQDKNYVYVVDSANIVHMRSFIPAGRKDQDYIIKSGLVQGERVVLEGIQNLKEGLKVIPRP